MIDQISRIPGLCQNCPIRDQNQSLQEKNTKLEQRITQLEAQNKTLKQRLARYENIRRDRALLKKLHRRRQTNINQFPRFPGRPKGYPGTTPRGPAIDQEKLSRRMPDNEGRFKPMVPSLDHSSFCTVLGQPTP